MVDWPIIAGESDCREIKSGGGVEVGEGKEAEKIRRNFRAGVDSVLSDHNTVKAITALVIISYWLS